MPKNHQYIIIDTGNTSQSTEVHIRKLLSQIPEGKTLLFHDQDQTLEGKTLFEIIDPRDIPPEYEIIKTKHSYKAIETKNSKNARHPNHKQPTKKPK